MDHNYQHQSSDYHNNSSRPSRFSSVPNSNKSEDRIQPPRLPFQVPNPQTTPQQDYFPPPPPPQHQGYEPPSNTAPFPQEGFQESAFPPPPTYSQQYRPHDQHYLPPPPPIEPVYQQPLSLVPTDYPSDNQNFCSSEQLQVGQMVTGKLD